MHAIYLRIKCHIKITILLNVSSVETQWPHRQVIILILLVRTILKRNTWKDMFSQGNQKCQMKSSLYILKKYVVLSKYVDLFHLIQLPYITT